MKRVEKPTLLDPQGEFELVVAVDGPGVVVEATEFGGELLGEAVNGEDAFGADAVDGF